MDKSLYRWILMVSLGWFALTACSPPGLSAPDIAVSLHNARSLVESGEVDTLRFTVYRADSLYLEEGDSGESEAQGYIAYREKEEPVSVQGNSYQEISLADSGAESNQRIEITGVPTGSGYRVLLEALDTRGDDDSSSISQRKWGAISDEFSIKAGRTTTVQLTMQELIDLDTVNSDIVVDVDSPEDLGTFFNGLELSAYLLEGVTFTADTLEADAYQWLVDGAPVETATASVFDYQPMEHNSSYSISDDQLVTLLLTVDGQQYSGSALVRLQSGFELDDYSPSPYSTLAFSSPREDVPVSWSAIPGAESYELYYSYYTPADYISNSIGGLTSPSFTLPDVPVDAEVTVDITAYSSSEQSIRGSLHFSTIQEGN